LKLNILLNLLWTPLKFLSPFLILFIGKPKVKANALTDQKDPIEITVNLEGEIYIGESLVEVENLIPRINAITEQNTEARIYIRGDRVVAYGRVMEIMSIINSAGYIKVALITQNMK